MTDLLKEAFKAASALPAEEQDMLAVAILAQANRDVDDAWDQSFAASGDVLAALADEALTDHRAGRTTPLDAGKL